MIVKFDALDRFETPNMYLCNPGCVYDDGVLTNVIGGISYTSDEEIVFNFNATSELNFRVYKTRLTDPDENAYAQMVYRQIQNRRLIFVEDIGFFVISSIDDSSSDGCFYKDVKAESCEVEIKNKKVPVAIVLEMTEDDEIPNPTYRFISGDSGYKGVLDIIAESLPMWDIGHVDDAVASRYRTFEDVSEDTNCLSFLLENIQDAYECIIVFDNINRLINVYDQDSYLVETSVHITQDDVINSIDISETSDDLYTALSVTGSDDLSIAAVNPLGGSTIYNFDYYISWMSEELQDKIAEWKSLVAEREGEYYTLNLEYYDLWSQSFTYEKEMEAAEAQLTMYRRCRDNIVAETGYDVISNPNPSISSALVTQINGYNVLIKQNGGEEIEIGEQVVETLAAIDNLIDEVQSIYDSNRSLKEEINQDMEEMAEDLASLREGVQITEYFVDGDDTSLLDELMNYIYEGSYNDDYIATTESMSYSEKFEQIKTLYDRAKRQLQRASEPKQEFSIDVENFIFAKAFEQWSSQLETGCLINVELGVNDIALLFLSTISINYDDKSLNLTFGNRFSKFDPKAMFDGVLGNIQKSANTLDYIKDLLYPVKSGEFNAMKEALSTSRNLTKESALSSDNEQVIIDDTGYTGRRIGDNGDMDPHQVKITGKNIVLTDDAWDSCKTAIGEIIVGDNATAYGVNAEAIIGNIIMGNQLHICDNNGNDIFTVMDNKLQSTIYGEDGESGINATITQLTQDAHSVEIAIQNVKEHMGEVDHVTTSNNYRFDSEGLHISEAGNEISNIIDNNGMYVYKNKGAQALEEKVLVADKDGVNALNLTARQYLIIGGDSRISQNSGGRSRFEPMVTDLGERRVACFFLGVEENEE